MKNMVMVKMALLGALLVAVLLPQVVLAKTSPEEVLGYLLAGSQVINMVKSSDNVGKPVLTNSPKNFDFSKIDCLVAIGKVNVTGSGEASFLMSPDTANLWLANKVSSSGAVGLVVDPNVEQNPDNIYRCNDSARQPKPSQEYNGIRPDVMYDMYIISTFSSSDTSVSTGRRSGDTSIGKSSRKLTMTMGLNRPQVASGVFLGGYEASITLRESDFNFSHSSGDYHLGYQKDRYNDEQEMILVAAGKLVAFLLDQVDADIGKSNASAQTKPEVQPIQEVQSVQPSSLTGQVNLILASGKPMAITVPETKPVSIGTEIWFVRAGTVVGKFAVVAVTSQTAKLELISGKEPTDGDGFAIVYP